MSVAVIINQKRKRNASDRLFEYDDGSPMMGRGVKQHNGRVGQCGISMPNRYIMLFDG